MRGQSSLEYLLILAAIMAIAVAVILVASKAMESGKTSARVSMDKSNCAIGDIELIGYDTPYGGTEGTAPRKVKPCGECVELERSGTADGWPEGVVYRSACKLGDYELRSYFVGGGWSVYLENSDGKYFVYGQKVEAGPPENAIFPVSWSANTYGHDSNGVCSNNANLDSIGKIGFGKNISFQFSGLDTDKKYKLVLSIKNADGKICYESNCQSVKDTDKSTISQISFDLGKINSETINIKVYSKSGWANICGGTGKPSEEYLHPPYLVPA